MKARSNGKPVRNGFLRPHRRRGLGTGPPIGIGTGQWGARGDEIKGTTRASSMAFGNSARRRCDDLAMGTIFGGVLLIGSMRGVAFHNLPVVNASESLSNDLIHAENRTACDSGPP